MIQLIFATSFTKTVDDTIQYAFGLGDGLPWGHIKQDMKNFASRTKDTFLIMGAKTFMSFPTPLPGRIHIVVTELGRPVPTTKDGTKPHAIMTMEQFDALLKTRLSNGTFVETGNVLSIDTVNDYISIIGGKTLIEKSIHYVDKIIHTSITKKHRVNSDVQIDKAIIDDIRVNYEVIETHWYQIDELTSITESVYEC